MWDMQGMHPPIQAVANMKCWKLLNIVQARKGSTDLECLRKKLKNLGRRPGFMPLYRFAGQNRRAKSLGGKFISVHKMQSVKLGLGSSVMKAVHMTRTCPPKPRTNTNLRSFQFKGMQCCRFILLGLFWLVNTLHLFMAFHTRGEQIEVLTRLALTHWPGCDCQYAWEWTLPNLLIAVLVYRFLEYHQMNIIYLYYMYIYIYVCV